MRKEIEDLLVELYPSFKDIAADDDDAKDDFWRELPDREKYDVNSKYLKQIGNPEYDYLVCWEPGRLDNDVEVTDYETFYEVDYDWWEFQKKSRWESIEDMQEWMEKNPAQTTPERVAQSINSFNDAYSDGYSIYLSGDWYRLIENDVFIYSQMISAKWYLFYEAEKYLDDLQEENIPYSFKDDDDFLNTLNERDPRKIYNANGRELELDSYQNKIREYQNNALLSHIDSIIRKYKRVFSGKTFRVDKGYEPGENFDPFTDFIYFDEESLRNVRPKKFLKDFGANQIAFVEFEKMIDELKDIVKQDFEKIYNANKVRFSKV